jgi:hypothetical protein
LAHSQNVPFAGKQYPPLSVPCCQPAEHTSFPPQILRHSSERFSFQNGSIGNFFFAGARTFFRSMDAAIFTYSSISSIPKDSLVLPAVSTNDRLVLGAELQDGGIIRGQNMISHPSESELEQSGEAQGMRHVNKAAGACPPLPAPIKRVFYMSTEGTHLLQEVGFLHRSIPRSVESSAVYSSFLRYIIVLSVVPQTASFLYRLFLLC